VTPGQKSAGTPLKTIIRRRPPALAGHPAGPSSKHFAAPAHHKQTLSINALQALSGELFAPFKNQYYQGFQRKGWRQARSVRYDLQN
jgi:hypothetical protein